MHVLLMLGLLGMLGGAEDTPAQAPPPSAKTPAKQEKAPAKAAEAALPPTVFADFGWAEWGLLGSARKFRQYATPPSGWFLRELRYAPFISNTDASVVIKGAGQPDYSAEGRIARAYGGTIWEGSLARTKFFELTPEEVDESHRVVNKFSVRQSITPDFAVSIKYRKDEERQFFESVRDPENQSIRYEDVTAAGRVGPGYFNLNLANWLYEDNLQAFPNTTAQSINVGYLWEVKPTISLETALSRMWLQQPDTPKSRVDTLAINGDVSLSPMTDLELQWRSRWLDMPNVLSAWTREQRIGSVKLAHKWRGWTGQIGLKVQKSERIRGDQSDIDVLSWQTWEGKLSGRLNRNLRMTLRGSQQTLANQPTMITSEPASLYWNQRDLLQWKLDGGGTDANGYLTYSYRHWRNGERRVDLSTHEVTMGGDWQVSPTLNLFSELSYDLWSGSTPSTDDPTFNLFLPNSRLFVFGLNWNVNPRTFVSLSYTNTRTFNENPLALTSGNTHGSYITLTGRYQMPHKCELGLTLAPWRYSDSVTSELNFNAALVLLTATARF